MESRAPTLHDYAPMRSASVSVKLLVLFGVICLAGATALEVLRSRRSACTSTFQIQCAVNLNEIGKGLALYADNNRGELPAHIDDVLNEIDDPRIFVCPASNDSPATRASTTQQSIVSVTQEPGHCSYVYVGKGTFNLLPGEAVLAYERLGNHPADSSDSVDGSNVLFADCKVIYVPAADFKKLLAELNAGQNPSPTGKLIHDRG